MFQDTRTIVHPHLLQLLDRQRQVIAAIAANPALAAAVNVRKTARCVIVTTNDEQAAHAVTLLASRNGAKGYRDYDPRRPQPDAAGYYRLTITF